MSSSHALFNFAPFAGLSRLVRRTPAAAKPASAESAAAAMRGPRHFMQARFISKSEVVLLDQLRKAMPGCDVFTQVALGALVQPPAYWPDEVRHASWRKYQGSIVDFVLWEPTEEQVLCLIELQSREPGETKERDAFRDAITGEAGYPLLRLRKSDNFSAEHLRERIFDALDNPPNPTTWAKERVVRAALARDGIEVY